MDQSNRITKDTSARKNTKLERMHTFMEVAALKASHEAYLNSMIQGYENKVAAMESDQEQEIKELNDSIASERNQMAQQQEAVVTEAVRKALAGSSTQTYLLKQQAQKLAEEKRDVEKTLDKELKKAKEMKSEHHMALNQRNSQITALRSNYEKEISSLKEKLKTGQNSWVEFTLKKHKGRNEKTKVCRLFSTLRDAASDIYAGGDILEFIREGCRISYIDARTKTLEQLGVKDGDVITAVKK